MRSAQRTAELNPTHIKDLVPDPANRRQHNPRNIGMVVDALHRVGAGRSIVIDEDNVVLAGNGVLEAAAEAGITKVRVVEVDGSELVAVRRSGLSADDKRALAIYDNRAGELAEWNPEQLQADVAAGLDLKPWFSEEELAKVLGQPAPKAGLTDPDDVPAVRATDIKLGDLFELGGHRLLCGDSTKADDVRRVMNGQVVDLLLTDPPYGIDLIKGKRGKVGGGTKEYPTREFATVHGDDALIDIAPLRSFAAHQVIWGGNYYAHLLPPSRCWFVWDKNHPVDRTFAGCELAWTSFENKHAKVYRVTWDGWTKEGEAGSKVHPTQKPVKLFTDVLGDLEDCAVVVDPYHGSGTTLVACEQMGRRCHAIEIDPSYIQVAIDRFSAFTGQQATKVGEAVCV